jgi:hypothetical protein
VHEPVKWVHSKDLPCLLFRFNGVIGDQVAQIPLHPYSKQIQLIRVFEVADRCPPEVAGHFQATFGIPDQFMRKISLILANLPDFLFFPS